MDLFPEFFRGNGMKCLSGDLSGRLPVETGSCDWIICQEGVEHLPNQLHFFAEMNRCLRPGGRLLLTTPNCSNLRSRWAHFLTESETLRVLPPNEVDSVWLNEGAVVALGEGAAASGGSADPRIYFGHLFSSGIHKLNVLSRCGGFELRTIHPSRINWTSFLLLGLFGPILLFVLFRNLFRSVRRRRFATIPEPYRRTVRLSTRWEVLCGGHLILEFEKVSEVREVARSLQGVLQSFDVRT